MPPITWEEKRERLEELVNHYQIVDYAPKAYKLILNACIGALEGNPGNPYILSYWNDLAHDERDLLSGGDGMPFLWGINHGTTMVPIRPIGADPVHHSWLHLVGSLNNHIYGWDGDAWTHFTEENTIDNRAAIYSWIEQVLEHQLNLGENRWREKLPFHHDIHAEDYRNGLHSPKRGTFVITSGEPSWHSLNEWDQWFYSHYLVRWNDGTEERFHITSPQSQFQFTNGVWRFLVT